MRNTEWLSKQPMPAYHLFQHFATTVFPSLVISWSRIIKRFEERRREKYSIREIALMKEQAILFLKD